MCGIAGFWTPGAPAPSLKARGREMISRILHRGPDGHDLHLDAGRGLCMGHARLSIVGLEDGGQPLYGGGDKRVLTVNGEFYGYQATRGLAAARGHEFHTRSDSEIALALHRRHGLDFVHHLRGEFAFALFDAEAERLVLVRDRFGIRPLYLHHGAAGVYWGSEIKALFAHPDVPRAFAPAGLLHQLGQVMAPGETAFQGIRAVQPGEMLIVTRGRAGLEITARRWWDADFPLDDAYERGRPDAHFVEEVREKLVEAVDLRLEADVGVAAFLSGGIDSCAIMGLASAMRQKPVTAFTIGFEDEAYDETGLAAEMAAACGADQKVLTIGADALYGENFRAALWHSERTFYNTLGVAKMLMARFVRDHGFKVVLTGEGSDEIFGGYAQFKRDMFRHADPEGARREAEMMARNGVFAGAILTEGHVEHPAWTARLGFTPGWLQPWIGVLAALGPILTDDYRDLLRDLDPLGRVAEGLDASRLQGRHPLDRAQYSWMKTMLEGQILGWAGERVDMAHAIETRPPFLDHHLAEAAMRIPPELRIRGGTEKWVLREAMRHILPEALYKREKFAFMAPPAHRGQPTGLQALASEYLAPERLRALGLVDPDRLAAWRRRVEAGADGADATRADIIQNHLIQLHALDEMFIKGAAAPPEGLARAA